VNTRGRLIVIVAGYVTLAIAGGMLATVGRAYGVPRQAGAIVYAGLCGFAMQQVYRWIAAKRR
jgi:hypothetical protein